jgi:type I restriction enzyme R subunit
VVGAEKRLGLVARDIVEHFENRLEAMDGKAMIVCMSRRICVELYREIVKLRPQWDGADDERGALKVVMTGSASDPADGQPHIRNKPRREALANRFRDPKDAFKLVLVRDMWLTGFDAPSLHTMYIDKPMRGHGLMQAIARVNRVFRDKPGGLVVDYLGLAQELKQALATYTESGGTGRTALDQDEAVAVMLEKHEVCAGLFHGFDWAKWTTGSPTERLGLLPAAQEHILAQESGKERCVGAVRELSQAFALAVPHAEALRVRDDVAFFQAVQAVLAKRAPGDARPEEDIEHAVRQIISRAVAPEGVIDIFAAAGLAKPDISILSEEFLAEVRGMPQRNLAVELLEKLLKGELATRRRKNVVQARSFAEMLEQTIRRYQNRAVEAAQVIEELIGLAKDMREARARGESLRLSEDELAFYDALETNDSAVKVLGDDTLRKIARELVETVRKNVTIDWTLRENVQAQLRVLVKRILRKHGYPPDKQEKATQTVLEQAALLSAEWAMA